jgi:hypothetical protein
LAPFAAINADPRVLEFYPKPLDFEETRALIDDFCASLPSLASPSGRSKSPAGDLLPARSDLPFRNLQRISRPCVEIGWRLSVDH